MSELGPFAKLAEMDSAVIEIMASEVVRNDPQRFIAFRDGYFGLPSQSRVRLYDIIVAASTADLRRRGVIA